MDYRTLALRAGVDAHGGLSLIGIYLEGFPDLHQAGAPTVLGNSKICRGSPQGNSSGRLSDGSVSDIVIGRRSVKLRGSSLFDDSIENYPPVLISMFCDVE